MAERDRESSIQVTPAYGADGDLLAAWAIQRLAEPELRTPSDIGMFQAFGVVKTLPDGSKKPLCVVIYNFYRRLQHGNDMRVIIASDSPAWCLPGVLQELFRYPFETAGCERLTAFIRDGNKRSLKLCQGLGFRKEGTLRKAHDGKTNAIVLSMLKSECKWLHRGQAAPKEVDNGRQERTFGTTGTKSHKANKPANGGKQRRAHHEREAKRDKSNRTRREHHVQA